MATTGVWKQEILTYVSAPPVSCLQSLFGRNIVSLQTFCHWTGGYPVCPLSTDEPCVPLDLQQSMSVTAGAGRLDVRRSCSDLHIYFLRGSAIFLSSGAGRIVSWVRMELGTPCMSRSSFRIVARRKGITGG